jgi:hypothetical protein
MIKSISTTNFTVLKKTAFEFGALNVIHGENGAGKTHLLKLLYAGKSVMVPGPRAEAPAAPSKAWLQPNLAAKLKGVFRPDALGRLASRKVGRNRAEVTLDFGARCSLEFSFDTASKTDVRVDALPTHWAEGPPIFLPTRELLTIFPGFVSLYETSILPFEETWRDLCILLGAPVARGPKSPAINALLVPLEEAMGGSLVLVGDKFYFKSPSGSMEVHLVAEGLRKLAMIARLIATGQLTEAGTLIWDEPEANLNPRLIKRVAHIICGLVRGGVQIFVATHSLFLMRELEILLSDKFKGLDTRFIGLSRSVEGVQVHQGPTPDDAGDIVALDENLEQSDRFLALES